MASLPIEEHGVIGDLHTVALVGTNGSIDWCCLPHFDSPSVFGAILDDQRGGRFQICPTVGGARTQQMYLPDTNILITRFLHPDGVGEVTDFMPIYGGDDQKDRPHRLVRMVLAVRGTVAFHLECCPAFDYARAPHQLEAREHGVLFHTRDLALGLCGSVPIQVEGDGAVAGFTLEAGQKAAFVLEAAHDPTHVGLQVTASEVETWFRDTREFWRGWLSHCRYYGRWRETVNRSALVLKLLCFEPTGAIVAAPTTSLPERIGGERNWDYRFTWVRDASFTLYAFLRIGFTREAEAFMRWIEARMRELEPDGALQIAYGIDGRHELHEETLDHLEGYQGSRPVRIGNDAYRQFQLDIYGELMDAVYLYNKHAPISYDLWANARRLLEWVSKHWDQPDAGIWEVRADPQHFVYSKMMCWVAFERAMRIARARGLPGPYGDWRQVRDDIYHAVIDKGWSDERRAFVQHYGSAHLDASLLLIPLVKFMGPTDPRMLATLDRIHEELASDSLVHRYDPELAAPDGLTGREGTFSMCSFWMVECLTRARRLDEARLTFEKMLTYANHLGLYAEEIGPSGEALGNFPQALTHLALISAAYNLDRELGRSR
ncbi:MAG: glycoside hydrolase family 15 protein [Candidatus Methylomirabilia bacterium]